MLGGNDLVVIEKIVELVMYRLLQNPRSFNSVSDMTDMAALSTCLHVEITVFAVNTLTRNELKLRSILYLAPSRGEGLVARFIRDVGDLISMKGTIN